MFFIGNFRDKYLIYIGNKADRVVERGGIYRVHMHCEWTKQKMLAIL